MRTLPVVMLGALLLSLAPTAALAADTPTPSPTAAPTPTAPWTGPPPGDDDGSSDYLFGELTSTPGSGPPGTTIRVTSKEPCGDRAGKVGPQAELYLLDEAKITTFDFAVKKLVKTDAKGDWTTTATVPANAKIGIVFFVYAACFPAGPIDSQSVPFMFYDGAEFTVTAADKAPVATPVSGNPNFTG